MFVLGLCLSLTIAFSKAFPAEYINFYPSTGLQSNYLYDFDDNGYGVGVYPYRVPTNPYYVYDVSEGRWIPKCNGSPSSPYHIHDSAPPPNIPLNGNHRRRANRRQGGSLRSGHSATFDAFRGAIAFG